MKINWKQLKTGSAHSPFRASNMRGKLMNEFKNTLFNTSQTVVELKIKTRTKLVLGVLPLLRILICFIGLFFRTTLGRPIATAYQYFTQSDWHLTSLTHPKFRPIGRLFRLLTPVITVIGILIKTETICLRCFMRHGGVWSICKERSSTHGVTATQNA